MSGRAENTGGNGRNNDGTFAKGNSGRPAGSKNKLKEQFWHDLHDTWKQGGQAALEAMRDKDPSGFIRVVASVMPQEAEINTNVRHIIADKPLTNDEWRRAYTDMVAAEGPSESVN